MRKVFRWIGLLVLASWAALAVAQVSAPGATAGAGGGGNATASADYRLGPGDQIRVQVYQNPDLTVETRVSEQGTINYPLIGAVEIGGTTIGDAEKKIAAALRSGNFLKQPQVNIVLLQVR